MPNSPKHLLVIRLSAMGDCAMAVPVLLSFKKAFPDSKITVLTKPFFKAIFNRIPGVEVVGAHTKNKHKGFWGIIKLGNELKSKFDIDQVADLHNVLRSKILCISFGIAGIQSAKIDKGRKEKKKLTRIKKKVIKPLKTTPQRYVDVFNKLGYDFDLTEKVFLEKPRLTQEIREIIGESYQKWIGIAPFAAHQAKTYPLDLMRKAIKKLDASEKYKIILFGGGEQEIKALEQLSTEYKHVISIAEKIQFTEELDLIGNLDVMISMDSGNGHLAAMFGVPVITIWGGTHPYAGFAPYAQPVENYILPDLKKYPFLPTSVFGNKQIEGYEDVMRSITPEQIPDRINTLLSE